jgi:hypothetical protein
MRMRQVRGHGRVSAGEVTPGVDDHAGATMKNLDGRRGDPHVDQGVNERMRHRVEVPVDVNVVVDFTRAVSQSPWMKRSAGSGWRAARSYCAKSAARDCPR